MVTYLYKSVSSHQQHFGVRSSLASLETVSRLDRVESALQAIVHYCLRYSIPPHPRYIHIFTTMDIDKLLDDLSGYISVARYYYLLSPTTDKTLVIVYHWAGTTICLDGQTTKSSRHWLLVKRRNCLRTKC